MQQNNNSENGQETVKKNPTLTIKIVLSVTVSITASLALAYSIPKIFNKPTQQPTQPSVSISGDGSGNGSNFGNGSNSGNSNNSGEIKIINQYNPSSAESANNHPVAPSSESPGTSVKPQEATNVSQTSSELPTRTPVSGSCECPYDTDSLGRSCGKRSAYFRPNGDRPVCYVSKQK